MIDAINPSALRINTLIHLLLQLFLQELLGIEIQPAQIATIDAITITIPHEEFLGIPTNWKPQEIALVSMSLNRHIPATNHPEKEQEPTTRISATTNPPFLQSKEKNESTPFGIDRERGGRGYRLVI